VREPTSTHKPRVRQAASSAAPPAASRRPKHIARNGRGKGRRPRPRAAARTCLAVLALRLGRRYELADALCQPAVPQVNVLAGGRRQEVLARAWPSWLGRKWGCEGMPR
jgi:hypothetical protein